MSEAAPLVVIPLREGTDLRITPGEVQLGERVVAIARLQDARQVSPDPVTIALRVAGEGLVEFHPAVPGQGAVALEAIFRLRPDLRPAGFEAPQTLPPGMPAQAPLPPPVAAVPYPAYPGYGMPPGYPMYPQYPPPGARPYVAAPPPPAPGGRLGVFPRDFGALLSGIFQLFGAYWQRWLLLGLVVALLPQVVAGAAQVVAVAISGQDPFAAVQLTPPSSAGASSTAGSPILSVLAVPQAQVPLLLALLVGAVVVALIAGAWETAVLSVGVREALFGRAPQIGACLRAGTRRLLPVLGAHVLLALLYLAIFLPEAIVTALLVVATASDVRPSGAVVVLGLLFFILFVPTIIALILLGVRMGLAPYLVATSRVGVFASLGMSWQLTRRHFWRIVGAVLIVGLLLTIITLPLSFTQYISYGFAMLVVLPLAGALAAPLSIITNVALLYDLRLRREGYHALMQQEAGPPLQP